MTRPVKRSYDSSARRAAAAKTRDAILTAAARLFGEHGYVGMTMQAIADEAGVALDTVYSAVGNKPQLVRDLIESAISGTGTAVPADEREYVRRIRAATTGREKLAIYARALRQIHGRLAPLFMALRDASAAHPELAALWREISERRAENMRRFAADLQATGDTRPELTRGEIADVVWATNAPELYVLLVEQRGWSPRRYERWLSDAWARLLLRTTP